MCLAVPMRVLSVADGTGIAEVGGVKKAVSFIMCPDVKVEDYVIVHAGFAIEILDENEAQERLKLFQKMANLEYPKN